MKTRIIHFSDTHEPARFETFRSLFDKRSVGLFNSRFRRNFLHDNRYFARGIEFILKNPPDLIVYTGDATSTGQPSEFRAALNYLIPVLERGIPLLYTPGNHDAYVRSASCDSALRHFYGLLTRNRRQYSPAPYLYCLNGLRFAVIHCALPTNPLLSCGKMTEETLAFLKRSAATKGSDPLICVGHFPLLDDSNPIHRSRHGLWNAREARALLESGGIDLSLCGHVHTPKATLSPTGRGEIIAGSLTRFGSMAEIEYDSDTSIFSMRRITLKDSPEQEKR